MLADPEFTPFDLPLRVNGRYASESQFVRANRIAIAPLVIAEKPATTTLASAFSTPAPRDHSSDASAHGSAMQSMGSVGSLFSSRRSSKSTTATRQPLLPTTSLQFHRLFQNPIAPTPSPATA
ncbi:hypothetical protein C8J56DRAFT_1040641 [Mycena floridula]|nr:hypothetical protein C8J56DRAFT_1040641 [Mycena floridula]